MKQVLFVVALVFVFTVSARADDLEMVGGVWRSSKSIGGDPNMFKIEVNGSSIAVTETSPVLVRHKNVAWAPGKAGKQFVFGPGDAQCVATLDDSNPDTIRVTCDRASMNWRRVSARPVAQKYRCSSGKYWMTGNRCLDGSQLAQLAKQQPNTNYPTELSCPPSFAYRGGRAGRSSISCYACRDDRFWSTLDGLCVDGSQCAWGVNAAGGSCNTKAATPPTKRYTFQRENHWSDTLETIRSVGDDQICARRCDARADCRVATYHDVTAKDGWANTCVLRSKSGKRHTEQVGIWSWVKP